MHTFSESELDFLAGHFVSWNHPVSERAGLPFEIDGGFFATKEVIGLLELVIHAPAPEKSSDGKDRWETLDDHVIRSIAELLNLKPTESERRADLTRKLVLAIEPTLLKILALIHPEIFERMTRSRKGLATALSALQQISRTRYELQLKPAEFEATTGWESRDSYTNALRDVIPERINQAHWAMLPKNIWESAFVVLLGLVADNREDLLKYLQRSNQQSGPRTRLRTLPPGLPDHRRLPPEGPEPLTTRRRSAEDFGTLIKEALQQQPRVEVIVGLPGWGKRTFVSAALADCPAPVIVADLLDCSEQVGVAQALLEALPKTTEEDRQSLDRRPVASAVRILEQHLAGPAVVVFENTHRTQSGLPADGLNEFVRKLHERGHSVVLESWTQRLELPPQLPPARVRTVDSNQLLPLSDEEISVWGQRMLGRPLSAEEHDDLSLFEGHPLLIREALRLLGRAREERLDLSVEMLELWQSFESLQREFEKTAAARAEGTGGRFELPALLWGWFGLMSWARPHADFFDDGRLMNRLRGLGLIELIEGTWKVGPWARLLGIRRCTERPSLVEEGSPGLAALAAQVPPQGVEAQRRHLARMGAFLASQRQRIEALLQEVPIPIVPESDVVLPEEKERYAAPAPKEIVRALQRPDYSREASPNLPIDIRLWLLDGAARNGDLTAFESHLQSLLASADLNDGRIADWRLVKQLHQALLRVQTSPLARQQFYQTVIPRISAASGNAHESLAQRAWLTRLVLAGAEAAIAAGVTPMMIEWRTRAEQLLAADPLPTSPINRSVAYDNRYRLRALAVRAARDLKTMNAANEEALAAIPTLTEQLPERRAVWARLEIRHLGPILRAQGPTPSRLQRLRQAIEDLSDDLQALTLSRPFLRRRRDYDPTVISTVQEALASRMHHVVQSSVRGRRIAAISKLLLDREKGRAHILDWARELQSELNSGLDAEGAYLLRLCFQTAGRDSHAMHELAEVCQAILRELVQRPWLVEEDGSLESLRASCLEFFAHKQLGAMSPGEDGDEPSVLQNMDVIQINKGERRLDRTFEAHLAASGEPWLWDQWAGWKLRFTQRRNAIDRRRQGSVEDRTRVAALADFVRRAEKALPDHPAASAVALRVARYVWDVPALKLHVRRLLTAHVDIRRRLELLRLMTDSLSAYLLAPQLLQVETDPGRDEDMRLLVQMLEELLGATYDERTTVLRGFLVEVLEHPTDLAYWTALAERAQTALGQPAEYWERVVGAAQEGPQSGLRERSDIEDLTDPQMLVLAARIFRFGAGNEQFPLALRQQFAELAVVAAMDADRWSKSVRRRREFLAPWQVGCSLGVALSIAPDGQLFGRSYSPVIGRKGGFLTWQELMDRELQAAQSIAVGKFRVLCDSTIARLRAALATPPRPPEGARFVPTG